MQERTDRAAPVDPSAELEETKARTNRIVRLNELFTGILSHDLRNPLQSILTAAELLIRRAPDPKFAATATRIVTSGNRMNRMIAQLLEFSRITTSGAPTIERVSTDAATIWRQAIDQLAGVGSDRVLLELIGDTIGSWDPDRLTQVATSLLSNALGHGTPEGKVTVAVDGSASDGIAIQIHNEGAVPEELLPKLFEPFQDGDRRRPRGDGLGLGLFLTDQIIAAHRGTVSVTSSPATGTRVEIRLPRG
jgi:two-component system, sensor histidine kinase and response regulator